MPYKFNESRRHKIPKAKYRVTNWPEYDAALVRRGDRRKFGGVRSRAVFSLLVSDQGWKRGLDCEAGEHRG